MTNDASPPRTRTVTCPGCGGPSLYSPANLYRPFCSERCKDIDLGAWANQEFAIPAKPDPDEGQGESPPLLQ